LAADDGGSSGANLVGMSLLPLDAYPFSWLAKEKKYIAVNETSNTKGNMNFNVEKCSKQEKNS